MSILITGGSGYIGSHICLELLRLGNDIIIVDNLSNSSGDSVQSLRNFFNVSIPFYKIDLRDENGLDTIFLENNIKYVIHLAGKKSVKESIEQPIYYYDNNVSSTIQLLKVMKKYNCFKLVFSSSATVYGGSSKSPISEGANIDPINPYGRTKAMIEMMLEDVVESEDPWKIVCLRYFNPVGLDKSKLLKEEASDLPENLFPYIQKVIRGELEFLTIFGADYPTSDGTPVRDYIHITDLAKAHQKALDFIFKLPEFCIEKYHVFNIGTGRGNSVLDIIKCFKAIGVPINYKIGSRRAGDAAKVYANSKKAEKILGWYSEKCLADMCKDTVL